MNRKEKYKSRRLRKRLLNTKYSFFVIFMCAFAFFSVGIVSDGTHSYFNANHTAIFDIQNAKKEDLVIITQGELLYEKKCTALQPVTIENIFDYKVIISIEGTIYTLQPGEKITHNQVVADNCGEFGDRSFTIIGYEQYFEHPVNLVVDQDKLNPCPEPSGNGQGRENDNGEGKHCGNNGNPVHDNPDDNSNSQETIEVNSDTREETVEAAKEDGSSEGDVEASNESEDSDK